MKLQRSGEGPRGPGSAPLDNEPPEGADPLLDRLKEQHGSLEDEAADLELERLALPDRVNTDDEAEKVTNFVAKVKKLRTRAEKTREEEKEPFLLSGRKVDAFFKGVTNPLDSIVSDYQARLNAHARAKAERERAERLERERLERERAEEARRQEAEARRRAEEARATAEAEAARIRSSADAEERREAEERMRVADQEAAEERKRAEAAAKEGAQADRQADAAQKAATGGAKLGKTTTDGASTTSTTFWNHRTKDEAALRESLGPLGPFIAADAIASAISAAKRQHVNAGTIEGLSIPGVEFFEDVKTNVRLSTKK